MTGAEALLDAVPRLIAAGIPDAQRDARVLLAFAMGIPPDRLTLHLPDTLTHAGKSLFATAVSARITRQPVSQITGFRLFWGRSFRVTPDILDPRPETETLVAQALQHPFARVLDLGTGSGCILLSLLADRPLATGLGVDISEPALDVAMQNARAFGTDKRVKFLPSNWFSHVHGHFDLIVSNPPYIAADEMPGLSPEVRDWEPHLALTPGGDGLAAYRVIARDAPARLISGGRLLVEIGPAQGQAVRDLFLAGGLTDIAISQDMDGRDRVVAAVKPQSGATG